MGMYNKSGVEYELLFIFFEPSNSDLFPLLEMRNAARTNLLLSCQILKYFPLVEIGLIIYYTIVFFCPHHLL